MHLSTLIPASCSSHIFIYITHKFHFFFIQCYKSLNFAYFFSRNPSPRKDIPCSPYNSFTYISIPYPIQTTLLS